VTALEVRAAMKALRLNTPDLAQEAGVTTRTVNRWQEDGVDGSADTLLRLWLRLDARGVEWRRHLGTLYI
jgi:transcriptional regulator with XRE-family HTH domain